MATPEESTRRAAEEAARKAAEAAEAARKAQEAAEAARRLLTEQERGFSNKSGKGDAEANGEIRGKGTEDKPSR